MAERVSTGGTKSFQYGRGHDPKLSGEEKQEIRGAYAQARERERRERRRKIIIGVIALIILIVILAAVFLRSS